MGKTSDRVSKEVADLRQLMTSVISGDVDVARTGEGAPGEAGDTPLRRVSVLLPQSAFTGA